MSYKKIQFNHNKLNLDQVKEIRKLLAEGKSARSIAASYNVHGQTILNIKTGHTWKSYTKQEMDDYKRICLDKAKRGEQCNLSKLCEEDVRDIKRRLRDGEKILVLAREYSTTESNVSQIKRGDNWNHVKVRKPETIFGNIEESSFNNVLKTWERSREHLQQQRCRPHSEIK